SNLLLQSAGVEKDPVLKLITHPLTIEFLAGACAGLLYQRGSKQTALLALAAGIALLLLGAAHVGPLPDLDAEPVDDWMRIICVGLPCGMIVYGMAAWEVKSKSIAPNWIVNLGNASYSTYLSHVMVMAAAGRGFGWLLSHGAPVGFLLVPVCLAIGNIYG